MVDILLVNPPSPEGEYVRVERCNQKKSAWGGSLWQPLPLMYMQAILNKKGYSTKLKDMVAENMSYEEGIDFVISHNPKYLVVNTAVPTLLNDCKFAKEIKKKLKNVNTICVGISTSLLPSLVSSYFDFAIVGDSEYAILDIIEKRNRFFINKINKTIFVKHEVDNLDDLPFPHLDDLDLDKYTLPFSRERLMLVEPGRGCPFKCIFCVVPVINEKVRYRSAKNFVDELERDYTKYNIKNFLFWMETVTLNKKLMLEICEEIKNRNLKIKWMAPSRVDTVDLELLKKMKEAGCWMLSFGIESVDQKVLDLIKKKITVQQIEKAIENAKKVGIKIVAHIIIGLPGQTRESVEKTINWLIEKKVNYAQFYCAVPFWGTELRKIAEKNGWIISNNPKDYEVDKSVMRNEFLSCREIEELRKKAYILFYMRPSVILKEIWENRFNPQYMLNLMKDGFLFLKEWAKK